MSKFRISALLAASSLLLSAAPSVNAFVMKAGVWEFSPKLDPRMYKGNHVCFSSEKNLAYVSVHDLADDVSTAVGASMGNAEPDPVCKTSESKNGQSVVIHSACRRPGDVHANFSKVVIKLNDSGTEGVVSVATNFSKKTHSVYHIRLVNSNSEKCIDSHKLGIGWGLNTGNPDVTDLFSQ